MCVWTLCVNEGDITMACKKKKTSTGGKKK